MEKIPLGLTMEINKEIPEFLREVLTTVFQEEAEVFLGELSGPSLLDKFPNEAKLALLHERMKYIFFGVISTVGVLIGNEVLKEHKTLIQEILLDVRKTALVPVVKHLELDEKPTTSTQFDRLNQNPPEKRN